jgi:hypothetical protein
MLVYEPGLEKKTPRAGEVASRRTRSEHGEVVRNCQKQKQGLCQPGKGCMNKELRIGGIAPQ